MQRSLNTDVLKKVTYLTGSIDLTLQLPAVPAKAPFDDTIVDFLNDVSRALMKNRAFKAYSDIITFAFWIRRTSVLKLKERFEKKGDALYLGRGVAFHIAPSNVPVNFAYSLVAGLLNGNANVVRVPGKKSAQVKIIVDVINSMLKRHEEMKPYIILVRYEKNKDINDLFSSISDVRIVWGGNNTIEEIRRSPLPPRSIEVTFADRYSLAVIDSDSYLAIEDKEQVAENFYNDTFFTDQNACTSPRIVIWTGDRTEEAKKVFWDEEHKLVKKKYTFQAIQGVNKLTKSCLVAAAKPGVKVEEHTDNLIIRVAVPEIKDGIMDYQDNSGYFYEYDCRNILEIREICNDKRCQTIAYIGDRKMVLPLITAGVKGIDRVVPIGKTMDFDLIWDGYDLSSLLTRTIALA